MLYGYIARAARPLLMHYDGYAAIWRYAIALFIRRHAYAMLITPLMANDYAPPYRHFAPFICFRCWAKMAYTLIFRCASYAT